MKAVDSLKTKARPNELPFIEKWSPHFYCLWKNKLLVGIVEVCVTHDGHPVISIAITKSLLLDHRDVGTLESIVKNGISPAIFPWEGHRLLW